MVKKLRSREGSLGRSLETCKPLSCDIVDETSLPSFGLGPGLKDVRRGSVLRGLEGGSDHAVDDGGLELLL